MTDRTNRRERRQRRNHGASHSDGMKLLSSIMRDGATTALRSVDERWFTEPEVNTFEFINQYYRRYNALPSVTALQENGMTLPDTTDPVEYHLGRCEERAMYRVITEHHGEFTAALRDANMSQAVSVMRTMLAQSTNLQATRDLSTITTEADEVFEEYQLDKFRTELKGITTGYEIVDRQTNGMQGGDVGILVGRPNLGKASAHHTPTLMADGTWKRHGDLEVGDKLASYDGRPNEVQQLHPQGKISNYWVTLSDGRKVEACANHLWRVYFRQWDEPRILKTSEIQDLLTKKRYQKRLWIDRVNGDFGERKNFSIDPYVMGCLLGDGALTQHPRISTADQQLLDLFNLRLPLSCYTKHIKDYDYSILGGLKPLLRDFGLMGTNSHTKFIPVAYMSACREQRLDLLRGLLDTDGTVGKTGHVSFSSVSEELAQGVTDLARSLGYWAKMKLSVRASGESFLVAVRGKGKAELFLLDRKRNRILESHQKDANLTIVSIEYSGEFDSQCITVSHPESLYVVDGYTVTHNTYLLLSMVVSAWLSGKSILFVSMEMTTKQIVKRIIAIIAKVDPFYFNRGRLSYHTENHIADVIRGFGNLPPIHFVAGKFRKTVEDINGYVLETMPDIIYIDGGYLVGSSRSGKNSARHDKLTEVIEDIKAMAVDRDRPVMTTVQFNREVRKNTKTGMDLAQIAGTDAIGQIASLVMGIQLGVRGNRTRTRLIEMLKNREGDLSKFVVNFSFTPLDFSYIGEYEDEQLVREEEDANQADQLRNSMM